MQQKKLFLPVLNLIKNICLIFDHILSRLYFNKNEFDNFLKRIYPVKTQHRLIRIGSDNDAGYLVPNDLNDIDVCFSPGVDDKASFEKQCYDEYGIKSYMCDYSVDGPPVDSKGFEFLKKYLNSYDDDINMTLENWVDSIGQQEKDYLLQMDIEGGEYDVITHTDKAFFKKFRILIIEFHDLNLLFTSTGFRSITSVFDKILENFMVVHTHPNNDRKPFKYKGYSVPYVMEFTFLRKDRITDYRYEKKFPNPLDMDNCKDRSTVILPEIFFDSTN